MKTLAMIVVALSCLRALAAIDPAALIPQEPIKFDLSTKGTGWEIATAPPDAKNVKRFFRGPLSAKKNSQPTLTVRVEPLAEKESDLKDYLKRWLKDYPKFGYNVLGHKPFKLDGHQAYVIDVVSVAGDRQARQVLSLRGNEAVLLTCLDQKDSFLNALPACNQIIRSLKWQ